MHDRLFGCVAQRREESPAQQRIERHRADRDGRQRAAVDPHHRQRRDHQQPVEHRLDEAGGQRLLDLLDRTEARHHVAGMALLEPLDRQAHQVREHVAQPLQVECARQVEHSPGPQRAGSDLDDHQQTETDHQREQQVAVRAEQRAIDHPLQEERRQQHEDLERQRKHEHLGQRTLQAAHRAEQLPQTDVLALGARLEAGAGHQLQHHAGEVTRDLGQRQSPHPVRRIVDDGDTALHLRQHDEVAQIPVQDARELQLRKMLELGAQGSRIELQLPRHRHQVGQRHALQRQREALPQRRQVAAKAVVRGHHGEAGQAALRCLGLQNHRQARRAEAHAQGVRHRS